jgi:UDP-N-acetylglucosamine--N-acetylmuramyl-(pentapeptide) pyrophosphoryl-undecaprenol N-acetylglucosamine transferase
MTQRILISTGGSGGHVVPATILYEHLKNQFHVSMSTDYRGMKFLNKKKYNLEIFNITPISKNIFLLPFQFFLIIYLIIKSISFLKKKKNRYINFNRWLYVSTLMFRIENLEY